MDRQGKTKIKRSSPFNRTQWETAVGIDNLRLRRQEEEFEEAREIQQGLLPSTIPQIPGYDISGAWQPARVVAGDYFDVFKLSDSKVALCIADVMGKRDAGRIAHVEPSGHGQGLRVRRHAAEGTVPESQSRHFEQYRCGPVHYFLLWVAGRRTGEVDLRERWPQCAHSPTSRWHGDSAGRRWCGAGDISG